MNKGEKGEWFFDQWTIGRRILVGFGLPVLIMALMGLYSYYVMLRLTGTAAMVTHTQTVLACSANLEVSISEALGAAQSYVIGAGESHRTLVNQRLEAVDREYAQLSGMIRDPGQARRAQALRPLIDAQIHLTRELVALRRNQGFEAARQLIVTDQANYAMNTLRTAFREFESREAELLRERDARAQAIAGKATFGLIFGSLMAIAIGLVTGGALSRSTSAHVRSSVSALSTTAAEILSATSQQASSTAEEAAAVHQTTSTVEEVKQTAQLAAEKARAVTETVSRTAQASQDGRRAVDESVQAMQEARSRMENLAGRILALSEQSQAIAEIMTTVKDLAEQSNLLAVNASIESAKAGEAGRGFGVVAAEVRALAEQSKQAAIQVRGILNEIQRATQAAVMAAEQGVKTVESGASVAAKAGDSIRMLSAGLTESSQAATQILAVVQQQAAGMDQVVLAMQSIQKASAQSVAANRQSEQSARNLTDAARQLNALIGGTGTQA